MNLFSKKSQKSNLIFKVGDKITPHSTSYHYGIVQDIVYTVDYIADCSALGYNELSLNEVNYVLRLRASLFKKATDIDIKHSKNILRKFIKENKITNHNPYVEYIEQLKRKDNRDYIEKLIREIKN